MLSAYGGEVYLAMTQVFKDNKCAHNKIFRARDRLLSIVD